LGQRLQARLVVREGDRDRRGIPRRGPDGGGLVLALAARRPRGPGRRQGQRGGPGFRGPRAVERRGHPADDEREGAEDRGAARDGGGLHRSPGPSWKPAALRKAASASSMAATSAARLALIAGLASRPEEPSDSLVAAA